MTGWTLRTRRVVIGLAILVVVSPAAVLDAPVGCGPHHVGALGWCMPSSTTYPIDIFPEMHYSPAYGRLEPPRLDVPAGAVPVTGRAPAVSFADAPSLHSPLSNGTADRERGADLYRVNCQACHGQQGRGDGFVAGYFQAASVPAPADLTSPAVQGMPEGQLYVIVTNGLGRMPAFGKLLNEQERWQVVEHILTLGSTGQ